MRVVRVEVGFDAYLWSVSGHEMNKVSSDLPADARVLSVESDYGRRVIILTVESSTFADVPELFAIPNWQPTLTIETTELLMLADLVSRRHDEWESETCMGCDRPWYRHSCPT